MAVCAVDVAFFARHMLHVNVIVLVSSLCPRQLSEKDRSDPRQEEFIINRYLIFNSLMREHFFSKTNLAPNALNILLS